MGEAIVLKKSEQGALKPIQLAHEPNIKIGHAWLKPARRILESGGHRELLEPRVAQLLTALARKRGAVLGRDELVDLCWSGRIVGEDAINRCVAKARRAGAAAGLEIATIPRVGYRLVWPHEGKSPNPSWMRSSLLAGLGVCVAIGAGAALWVIASRPATNEAPTVAISAPTVLLLPFTADSSDADGRKLAAAARDAVAHTLSPGPFSVIDSMPQRGRAPADFLISGQTSRMPDKVVITVRMEEMAHHVVVFSRQFEASGVKAWELPDRVGAQVAFGLSWIAPLLELERRHPSGLATTAPFLQMMSSGLESVSDLHLYQESRRLAARAPNSPLAQYTLAFMTPWVLGQLPREDRAEAVAAARRAADRTLKLAPEFGGAYLPWCLLHSEQRRVQCEDRLRAGMRADPDYPLNSWFLSSLLNDVGRNREAADLAAISLAHDQYVWFKIGLMLRMLEVTGQTAEAAEIYRRSTRWWPGNDDIFWFRASGMLLRGDFEAAERFRREVASESHGYEPVAGLVPALQSNAAGRVRSLCAQFAHDQQWFKGRALQCMYALAQAGDLDGAYRFADRGQYSRRGRTPADEERIWLDNPNPNPVVYLTGPVAAPLRRDPRYVAAAERVGLLEYWRSGRPPDFCRTDPEPICAQLLKRS
jgi:DNA-binding winged helix-turn-helix (wHTH) protein/TolB-like protein